MLKTLLYSMFMHLIVVTPFLGAVTLKTMPNQPVTQSAHFSSLRSTFDRSTKTSYDLKTTLSLQEMPEGSFMFEALYDDLVYDYDHENDNLFYYTHEIFNSNVPDGSPKEAEWKSISNHPYLFIVAGDTIASDEKNVFFPTYANHPYYQVVFRALHYVTHHDIYFGHVFKLDVDGKTWTYKITKFDKDNVYFDIAINSADFSGTGSGYWNKHNALQGECKFRYSRIAKPNQDLSYSTTFSLSSTVLKK